MASAMRIRMASPMTPARGERETGGEHHRPDEQDQPGPVASPIHRAVPADRALPGEGERQRPARDEHHGRDQRVGEERAAPRLDHGTPDDRDQREPRDAEPQHARRRRVADREPGIGEPTQHGQPGDPATRVPSDALARSPARRASRAPARRSQPIAPAARHSPRPTTAHRAPRRGPSVRAATSAGDDERDQDRDAQDRGLQPDDPG